MVNLLVKEPLDVSVEPVKQLRDVEDTHLAELLDDCAIFEVGYVD